MQAPPLNVEYWASLYPVYTDYTEAYDAAMEYDDFVDRARALWGWKGLNRSVTFEQVSDVLEALDQEAYLTQDPQGAIESLSAVLMNDGPYASQSLVTSAFLLHLMASESGRYSVRFPIYDRRVWNAYVYLWGVRGEGEQLFSQASTSSAQYAEFCREFAESCRDAEACDYERALFMFGRFISKLSPQGTRTSIDRIDETLDNLENALADRGDDPGYALVDTGGIRSLE